VVARGNVGESVDSARLSWTATGRETPFLGAMSFTTGCQGESGEIVRTLARGERLQVSKRDRSRLVLSSPGRVELVRRSFAMSAVDRMGYRLWPTCSTTRASPRRGTRNGRTSTRARGRPRPSGSSSRTPCTSATWSGTGGPMRASSRSRTDGRRSAKRRTVHASSPTLRRTGSTSRRPIRGSSAVVSSMQPSRPGENREPVLSRGAHRGPLRTGDFTPAHGPTKRGPPSVGAAVLSWKW